MRTWAAIPNASPASFWCSSRKSTKFWLAGLKTSFWDLSFTVTIDWGLTYFLRKTAGIPTRSSRVGLLVFLTLCNASTSWETESSWPYHLQLAGCEIWGLFGKGLQTAQTSRTSRQKWASLWWGTYGTRKFDEGCCWNLQICCYFPPVEGPTKFGRLQFSLRCFHCGTAVGSRSAFFLLAWRNSTWSVGDFFENSSHHAIGVVCAKIWCRLAVRSRRFRMRIILGAVPLRSLVSFFYVFRDVSGTTLEWPWISRSRRNSSSPDRGPKMRLSVLLISRDNFLITLPSHSCDTWVVESSDNLVTLVFCAWLLLGCSSWFSFLRAGNILLFPGTAIFSTKVLKSDQNWKTFWEGNQMVIS